MDNLTEILNKSKDKQQLKIEDEVLLQPYAHISRNSNTGEDPLSLLAGGLNQWMNIPEDQLNAILDIVKMLRDSSLLIDDIQDNSQLRRGALVAHSIYGIAHTMNAANYVYFLSLEKAFELNHPEAVKIVNEQMKEMHRGQGMHVYWRDNFICPTEEEYKQMVIKKTGSIFFLITRLMQLFSTNKNDFTIFTTILTLYYQTREDYCNLVCNQYAERRGFCSDVAEGNFSLPIIHAINIDKNNQTIVDILKQRSTDIEIKKKCLHTMNRLGSFVYTKQVLENLNKEARFEIETLGPNEQINEMLNQLRLCHLEY